MLPSPLQIQSRKSALSAQFPCWSIDTSSVLGKYITMAALYWSTETRNYFTVYFYTLFFLTAQLPTPSFTGQTLLFFLNPFPPTTPTPLNCCIWKTKMHTFESSVCGYPFVFRWISYSSNRKLSLLKVKYANMHWILRTCIIYAAGSFYNPWLQKVGTLWKT